MKMYDTKIALFTLMLASAIAFSYAQEQQQTRRQLIQQQRLERIQLRQQQMERQLAALPTIPQNFVSFLFFWENLISLGISCDGKYFRINFFCKSS